MEHFDLVEFWGLFGDWVGAEELVLVNNEGSFVKKGSYSVALSFVNTKQSKHLVF